MMKHTDITMDDLAEVVSDVVAEVVQEEERKRKRLEWEIKIWKAYVHEVQPFEDEFERQMLDLFADMEREILENMTSKRAVRNAVQKDKIGSWLFGQSIWERRFQRTGIELIEAIALFFGSRTIGELPVIGVSFDVTDPKVAKVLRARSIKFAKEVVGTTEKHLRGILAAGIEAGESIPELKNGIRKYFETDTIPDRAGMIARTETIWASNEGTDHGYIQSGVVEGKEWVVADDERLCPYCRRMDEEFGEGKGIPVDQPFMEKGSTVEPSASGEGKTRARMKLDYETVRHPPLHPKCRCTIVPVIKEI